MTNEKRYNLNCQVGKPKQFYVKEESNLAAWFFTMHKNLFLSDYVHDVCRRCLV